MNYLSYFSTLPAASCHFLCVSWFAAARREWRGSLRTETIPESQLPPENWMSYLWHLVSSVLVGMLLKIVALKKDLGNTFLILCGLYQNTLYHYMCASVTFVLLWNTLTSPPPCSPFETKSLSNLRLTVYCCWMKNPEPSQKKIPCSLHFHIFKFIILASQQSKFTQLRCLRPWWCDAVFVAWVTMFKCFATCTAILILPFPVITYFSETEPHPMYIFSIDSILEVYWLINWKKVKDANLASTISAFKSNLFLYLSFGYWR